MASGPPLPTIIVDRFGNESGACVYDSGSIPAGAAAAAGADRGPLKNGWMVGPGEIDSIALRCSVDTQLEGVVMYGWCSSSSSHTASSSSPSVVALEGPIAGATLDSNSLASGTTLRPTGHVAGGSICPETGAGRGPSAIHPAPVVEDTTGTGTGTGGIEVSMSAKIAVF